MNISTILVVDDDRQIRRVLRTTLLSSGYDVVEATNADDAIGMIIRERPDLVLLDVNMSELSGLETCSKIRSSFQGPIIMVTVRESERDKILALDSGADDYVVKPFAVGELLARIRANLRRRTREDLLLKIETLELYWDFDSRLIEVRGNRVHLTPKEFDVLRFLVIHLGKPVTHKSVLQNVWGPDHIEETEYLRVVINQLRKKIERDPARPKYIITEQCVGYSFQLPGEVREKAFRRKP
jgi:two-component system, OmpR family, KDP operon response regulator KdpE